MKKEQDLNDKRIKRKIMGWTGFLITYVVLLLLAGFQTGIIVMPLFEKLHPFFQVVLVMGYWALVTLTLSLIINKQIEKAYDNPMRRLSKSAKKVAEGDFSVYVEPTHTPDKYDYIDVMFRDFNVMVQELGSIETLKNDFVTNVSHEIKTPLAIIKNSAAFLKNKDLDNNTQAEYIDTIIKATDNLSSLVTNILKLNKLENQEIDTPPEKYNLCTQLCDCIFSFESLLDEKNIEIVTNIEDKLIITSDRSMLEIVWNNLFSNALKFTENGGTISFFQTSDENTITVSISDTGCGMNNETIKHIFDKFYQGDTSHSEEGNGLGLALAYRIIERLGGTLSVVSKLGEGSTFIVKLPIGM